MKKTHVNLTGGSNQQCTAETVYRRLIASPDAISVAAYGSKWGWVMDDDEGVRVLAMIRDGSRPLLFGEYKHPQDWQETQAVRDHTGHVQPDDMVYDPAAEMIVSRFGSDRGAKRRDVDRVVQKIAGKETEVTKVRDGIGRLLRDDTIDADMYEIAVDFQNNFLISSYSNFVGCDMMGVGGGGGAGPEGFLQMRIMAADVVDAYIDLVGGPDSVNGIALRWVIGIGTNVRDLAKNKPLHPHGGAADKAYWRGAVVSALSMIKGAQTNKKSRLMHTGQRPSKLPSQLSSQPLPQKD